VRSTLLWIALGLGGVGIVMVMPSPVQAQRWHGGWRNAWHGGYSGGYYGRASWGRPYAYGGWGWGGYYGYPWYYPTPAYYPSYLYSYPLDASVPPVPEPPAVPQPAASIYSSSSGRASAPSPEQSSISRVLTASRVANENGRLRWPLGLQILGNGQSGHQADELRGQLDSLFQQAAAQAADGAFDPKILDQISQDVDKLRTLLIHDRDDRGVLAAAVYDEAERFLNELVKAEKAMRQGLKTQATASR
jgi:hypothetical protein